MSAAYDIDAVQSSYAGIPVLRLSQLRIKKACISAIIGPNGAGKSTLMNVLAFLKNFESGEIRFFGEKVRSRDIVDLRRRVGLVPQNPYLLRGSVLDNVELGLKLHGTAFSARRMRAYAALEQLGIARFAKLPANSLSGGEIQKVALARVLAFDPEVILFDEPFTYLDPDSVALLEDIMRDLSNRMQRTVIFSTHAHLDGMALADHVISIVDGKSVETAVVNLFSGHAENGRFNTGQISVVLANATEQGRYIAISPNEIVLSLEPLKSSIRNRYLGQITAISADNDIVRISIDAGERFHALVTRQALAELGLNLYDQVWVNFKSTAVKLLES